MKPNKKQFMVAIALPLIFLGVTVASKSYWVGSSIVGLSALAFIVASLIGKRRRKGKSPNQNQVQVKSEQAVNA